MSLPILRLVSFFIKKENKLIFMSLVYEKLPDMCLNCGMIGCVDRECTKIPPRSHSSTISEWKYSKLLRAQVFSNQKTRSSNSPPLKKRDTSKGDSPIDVTQIN